jgi:hypothetical protein
VYDVGEHRRFAVSFTDYLYPLLSLAICVTLAAEHLLGRRLFPAGRWGTLVIAFPLLFLYLGSAWISMYVTRQSLRALGANAQANDLGEIMIRTMFGFLFLVYFMSREHRHEAEDRTASAVKAA